MDSKNKNRVLVSACLLGIPCQYDGKVAKRVLKQETINNYGELLIPVCPEQLSGLPTPRPPVEIKDGDGFSVLNDNAKVITEAGDDLTDKFLHGAEQTLKIARLTKCSKMITQKRSPSCSCSLIYDGTFSHTRIEGYGVTAAYLKSNGVDVIDVDDFE